MNDQEKPAYRWQMLIYLSAINLFFNGIAVNVVPPLFPRISSELNLNYAQIGSIVGAPALGMLLFSLIGGFMIPWLMGMVMTAFNAPIGIYFIAVLALIPPVLILFVRETGRKGI